MFSWMKQEKNIMCGYILLYGALVWNHEEYCAIIRDLIIENQSLYSVCYNVFQEIGYTSSAVILSNYFASRSE